MKFYSPKNFMKGRRPQRFSDSKIVKESKLTRTMLEYQLDTLGNRKQETDFEEFSRKLCQLEICPNLRPQTGSTGGGDSKTDSESIPISSQIQISFFQGRDNQTSERFAFAFSTQKDWSGKIRGDVEEIWGTDRNYSQVYCVTSQFARDKTRAELEDELFKKFNIRVIILDKNWILDRVFGNKREKLAIEELKLDSEFEEKKEIGPLDYQRRKAFDEIAVLIQDDVSNNQITLKTVDNTLMVSVLAAELEEARVDVESLFDRAIRFADKYGTDNQHFTALYKKAWITFFWFEDFDEFKILYDEVEKVALDSDNIYNTERLNNLWTLLFSLTFNSNIISKELLKEKTTNLESKLQLFKDNKTNFSSAVEAQALLCFMKLMINRDDNLEVSKIFQQLKDVFDEAYNLLGFPFEITFQILNELDDEFSGEEAYENLQEWLVNVVSEREGDKSTGKVFLNRGIQHLKANRLYEAIDFLGKALIRFHKDESRDSLVRALYFLSIAYEDVGLLWASRGALLHAASYATNDLWKYTEINTMQLVCADRLKLIELRLGRIGFALEWHKIYRILAFQIAQNDDDRNKIVEKSLYFGSLMGLLLIKTPDEELKNLEKLPDTLTKWDLDFAAFGIIYRLSGKDSLPKSFVGNMTSEEIENFFNSFLSQPAQAKLPEVPSYYIQSVVELKSSILGCDFILTTPNSSPALEIGESILAALEGFLSTTPKLNAVSRDSTVNLTVSIDDSMLTEIKYSLKTGGKFGANITCGKFNPHLISRQDQDNIFSSISDIVLDIVANTIEFKNFQKDITRLFRDQEVMNRAISFSSSLVTIGNVLGTSPKSSILQWIDEENTLFLYDPEKNGKPIANLAINDNESETETLKQSHSIFIRHNEIKNISIIRHHLWDKAGWNGVAYFDGTSNPPIMALMFTNVDIATEIFKDWKESYGNYDKNEVIKISIIRKINKDNPAWYTVLITTNMDLAKLKSRFITVGRIHTLTPDTTINLDRFLESFRKWGSYLLAPTIIKDNKIPPKVIMEIGIVKKTLTEKQAWEIGANDIEGMAISEDMKPIIPQKVTNAPVLELLKQKKLRAIK